MIDDRGVEQLVARQAHNLEVACSSPASATNDDITSCNNNKLCRFFVLWCDKSATKLIKQIDKLFIFTGIISIKDVNIIAYICVKLYIAIYNNC